MHSYLRIKLVQENLALAISLWAAAQRGYITAGFIPGHSEILTGSGKILNVSTPLRLGDNANLVRCINNKIRGSFALSVINTHLTLSTVYANSPLEETGPDLRAARCSLYLLFHTLSQDMMRPVWRCPAEYRQRYNVGPAGFLLDATHLDGKEVFWDDFGGLPNYLDLLEYCKERVASSPESFATALPMPFESSLETIPLEICPATDGPGAVFFSAATGPATTVPAAVGPAAVSPDAAVPVLAGATLAAQLHPAAPLGTQPPLPIDGLLPQSSGSDPDSGPVSDSAAAFVSTCGVIAPEAMIIARELYGHYQTWCRETDREPLSQRSFGMRLTDLGFDRKRRGRGRHWWVGLGLAER